MIRVRTKTVIKLATDTMNIDLEFPKGSSISGIMGQMLGYMITNHGVEKVRIAVNKKLDKAEEREKAQQENSNG